MSNYYTSLACEAQKRYTSKLMLDGDDVCLPDPYNISSDLWLNDVTEWPNLEFGDLFMYLIDTEGIYTKEKLKAYKSLDAYNYYFNGYVHTVYYYGLPKWKMCVLKAMVNPSQRSAENAHEAWVIINTVDSSIKTAHCKCMAGLVN